MTDLHTITEAPEPDIVALILRDLMGLLPGLTPQIAHDIERQIREQYGGLRVRIPKRAKYLTAEQRNDLFIDGLTTKPVSELTSKHKISRSTLYREMKKGGRFRTD